MVEVGLVQPLCLSELGSLFKGGQWFRVRLWASAASHEFFGHRVHFGSWWSSQVQHKINPKPLHYVTISVLFLWTFITSWSAKAWAKIRRNDVDRPNMCQWCLLPNGYCFSVRRVQNYLDLNNLFISAWKAGKQKLDWFYLLLWF